MHQTPGHAGTLESAVGALILFVLIITAAGVYKVQRDVNMARFGVVGEIQTLSSEQPGANKANKSAISFASLATDDFSPVGNAETYDTDNLYEKIDGKAPMYQEAGFQKLTTQRFANGKNPDWGLELYLYDMGGVKNAFSVYSRQKRADAEDINDLDKMSFGYQAGNAICITRGRYYVEMIGFAEAPQLLKAMKSIAHNLSAKLPSNEDDKIIELGYFPAEGTVAGSWKLQLDNAFGFDGLTDTYSAQYKTGDKTVSIFFSRRKNADEAKAVAKNYYDFLITNGAKASSIDSESLKSAGASVLDFYGNTEIVFSAGVFVGGVHEADNKEAAEKAAEVLIDRLKKVTGEIGG
jgi:hypothetical protein